MHLVTDTLQVREMYRLWGDVGSILIFQLQNEIAEVCDVPL